MNTHGRICKEFIRKSGWQISIWSITKIQLNTIEEAIYFNISHEGVHLGSVLALKCAINAMKNE